MLSVAGRADLVVLAWPHLRDSFFTLHATAHYGWDGQTWPVQYLRSKDQAFTVAKQENTCKTELLKANKPTSYD